MNILRPVGQYYGLLSARLWFVLNDCGRNAAGRTVTVSEDNQETLESKI